MAGNYDIQAAKARAWFLQYDQEALIRKLRLEADEQYLYTRFLGSAYRLNRKTGDLERREGETWVSGNSFGETMTLLDLICDSSPKRSVSGRWKNMQSFGNQFHRGLLEDGVDPTAEYFAANAEAFRRSCEALGGTRLTQGDVGYSVEVFDGLPMAIQLWIGDDEFPSRLKIMWDENALQYLKYETMYFCKGYLLEKLRRGME